MYSANKRCGQTACSSASSHKPFLWEGLDGFKVLLKTGGMACLQVPTPFLHHSAPRVITGPLVRAWRQSLASFPALSIFLRLDIHLQPICMACRHYLVELCACSSFCIISVEAVLPESFGLICICASSLVPASSCGVLFLLFYVRAMLSGCVWLLLFCDSGATCRPSQEGLSGAVAGYRCMLCSMPSCRCIMPAVLLWKCCCKSILAVSLAV